jgi:hypothetical protein
MAYLRRRPAADYLSGKLGTRISDRTIEQKPIPYQVIAGKALYAEEDLDHYVMTLLSTPVRIKGKPETEVAD